MSNFSKGQTLVIAACLVSLISIGLMISRQIQRPATDLRTVRIYCAVSLRQPVEEIIAHYALDHDVQFETSYLASGQLVAEIHASNKAGVYFAADQSYVEQLQNLLDVGPEDQLKVITHMPICYHRPQVISNDKSATYSDLLVGHRRVSLADPATAAIGRVTRQLLNEDWDKIRDSATVMRTNVSQVGSDVNSDFVEMGIVWDSMLDELNHVVAVSCRPFSDAYSPIAVSLVDRRSASTDSELVKFYHFVTTSNVTRNAFERSGFTITPLESIE